MAALVFAAPAGAELSAARLDGANLARLRVAGPDAVSGLGHAAVLRASLDALAEARD